MLLYQIYGIIVIVRRRLPFLQKTEKKRMIIATVCFAVFAVTVWFLVKAIFFPTVELGLKRLPAIAFFYDTIEYIGSCMAALCRAL